MFAFFFIFLLYLTVCMCASSDHVHSHSCHFKHTEKQIDKQTFYKWKSSSFSIHIRSYIHTYTHTQSLWVCQLNGAKYLCDKWALLIVYWKYPLLLLNCTVFNLHVHLCTNVNMHGLRAKGTHSFEYFDLCAFEHTLSLSNLVQMILHFCNKNQTKTWWRRGEGDKGCGTGKTRAS